MYINVILSVAFKSYPHSFFMVAISFIVKNTTVTVRSLYEWPPLHGRNIADTAQNTI